jgi:uncharacterized protein with HEPN domain
MNREALKYLFDIKIYTEDIELFMQGIENVNQFLNDKKTIAAVERCLIIIGEAVNNFRKVEQQIIIDDANKIYGLRNRLVHAYDAIEDETLYVIIKQHLPVLKQQVDKLIEENFKSKS